MIMNHVFSSYWLKWLAGLVSVLWQILQRVQIVTTLSLGLIHVYIYCNRVITPHWWLWLVVGDRLLWVFVAFLFIYNYYINLLYVKIEDLM